MTELEVKTFTTGVRRDEDARILGECVLDSLALRDVHRAVEAHTSKPRSVRNSYSISWVSTNSVNTSTLRSRSPSSAWRR